MIDYEGDPKKHYVRYNGWLPFCKQRKALLLESLKSSKQKRSLRYFTFCAVSAVDVLMLNYEGIIRASKKQPFKMVTFFDKSNDLVDQTKKRIPGARGFTGNFVNLMLSEEFAELDDFGDEVVDVSVLLESPPTKLDEYATRTAMREKAQLGGLFNSFPYDIVNLDLEGYLFRPGDEFPGRLLNAFRRILKWQRRPVFVGAGTKPKNLGPIEGFTLMFTTQIGPANLSDDYLQLLRRVIAENVATNAELDAALRRMFGTSDPTVVERENFDAFFKLSVPKQLSRLILDEDWYIDSESGIRTFCFERPCKDGTYKMLHFVMHIHRQSPDISHRASNTPTKEAKESYISIVKRIFELKEDNVVLDTDTEVQLKDHLRHVCESAKH